MCHAAAAACAAVAAFGGDAAAAAAVFGASADAGASSLSTTSIRPEGHCQALAELVVTRAGCWLLGLGKPGEGAQHLGPRRRALCALPRTPPGGGCWVLAVVHMTVDVCGFVHLIRPGAVAPAAVPLLDLAATKSSTT
jgi:hypothetical protein